MSAKVPPLGDGGLAAVRLARERWEALVEDSGIKYAFEDGESTPKELIARQLDEMITRLQEDAP